MTAAVLLLMVDLMGTIRPPATLLRYCRGQFVYSGHNRRKCPKPGYLVQLVARGGWTAIVFEDSATRALAGYQAGVDDAHFAIADAHAQGYPPGCSIFATADFDADPNRIRDYVTGFSKTVRAGGFSMGLYANGACIRTFKSEGLITWGWLTCSGGFRGSRDHTGVDVWQRCAGQDGQIAIPGYSIDTNHILTVGGYIAAWGQHPGQVSADRKAIAAFPGVIRPGDAGTKVAMATVVLVMLGERGFASRPLRLARKQGVGKVRAWKRWQKAHGLVPDGVVGPVTWAKADEVLSAGKR